MGKSKQVCGRVCWERCDLCGMLSNQKVMKAKPCKSKEQCTAKIIGSMSKKVDTRIESRATQKDINYFMEWVTI